MKTIKQTRRAVFICLACILLMLSGCLTSKKLDKFVAAQYGNELPKPRKKKKAEIEVMVLPTASNSLISTTKHKTDKFLPLLVYWKYDHRQSCSLNPAIAVTNFSNALNSLASKGLTDKLNGRKLELTVEQAPSAFSLVAKENMVWLVYAVSWAKIYIEPDMKDLIVTYRLVGGDQEVKTGKITVENMDKNKGLRFFQSWKSATSEYLSAYNANFTTMTKTFVSQLTNEL
jgi:hypothetical protein